MNTLFVPHHVACQSGVGDHDQATRANGGTHVAATAPGSERDHSASRHQSPTPALARTPCEPSTGLLQGLYDSESASSAIVHQQGKHYNNRWSRSPALGPDHSFVFQPATQASPPPNFEMTRIQSAQRVRRAEYNLPHLFLVHQDSGVQALAPLSARTDIEASKPQPAAENWLFKRLSRRHTNRVKLVWIYGFVLTVFVLTTGLHPIRKHLALGGGTSLSAIAVASTSLDAPLRCNVGMGGESGEDANSGANALSGTVDIQGSTGTSLSSDIWGWKRHKGIVYANSHNDEMHGDRAFTHALSLGLAAIEADVWHVPAASHPGLDSDSDSVLLVGHDDKDLRKPRTLKNVYLDPIWDILERENGGNDGARGWKGVFTDKGVPDQTLLLMIDTKNEVDATYAELQRLLIPFREKGYLSHFVRSDSPDASITDGKLTLGPLTVIGTGDTPINSILSENPRYIFKDGPLTKLDQPITYPDPISGNLIQVDWHPSFAPMASAKLSVASHVSYLTSFTIFSPIRYAFGLTSFTPSFLADADPPRFVRGTHARGIESRWWGVARHPKLLRWALWGYVKDIGTDWLNADDLDEVAEFSRKRSQNDKFCI